MQAASKRHLKFECKECNFIFETGIFYVFGGRAMKKAWEASIYF